MSRSQWGAFFGFGLVGSVIGAVVSPLLLAAFMGGTGDGSPDRHGPTLRDLHARLQRLEATLAAAQPSGESAESAIATTGPDVLAADTAAELAALRLRVAELEAAMAAPSPTAANPPGVPSPAPNVVPPPDVAAMADAMRAVIDERIRHAELRRALAEIRESLTGALNRLVDAELIPADREIVAALLAAFDAFSQPMAAGAHGLDPAEWAFDGLFGAPFAGILGAETAGRVAGVVQYRNGRFRVDGDRLDDPASIPRNESDMGLLGANGELAGELAGRWDAHVYRFTISTPGLTHIEVRFSASVADVDIALKNATGETVAESTGNGDVETIDRFLAVGEYRLMIYLFDAAPANGMPYRVHLGFPVPEMLPENLELAGRIGPDESRSFEVVLGAGPHVLTLVGDPLAVDLDVYVMDDRGEQIAVGESEDGSEDVLFESRGGRYLVLVRNLGDVPATFSLQVRATQ